MEEARHAVMPDGDDWTGGTVIDIEALRLMLEELDQYVPGYNEGLNTSIHELDRPIEGGSRSVVVKGADHADVFRG